MPVLLNEWKINLSTTAIRWDKSVARKRLFTSNNWPSDKKYKMLYNVRGY